MATVDKRRYASRPGTPRPIERCDGHKILDNGRAMLRTLNFHVPPACDSDGDELPRGSRR